MRLGEANESDREGDGGDERKTRERRWEERGGECRRETREENQTEGEGIVKEERVWWGCPCSSPARDLHCP